MTENGKKIILFCSGIGITLISILSFNLLYDKHSRKRFRKKIKSNNIDFENMGPEIVRKNKTN